jgi:hypothetical protein
MKMLAAAVLLVALTACASTGTATAAKPASQPASGKALPFAPPPPSMSVEEGIMCAADVRQCADGSSVSRNAAKACAFDPCPGETQQ